MGVRQSIIMVQDTTSSKNVFITGCDENTAWMLKWFTFNFKYHNPHSKLIVYDFGMSPTTRLTLNPRDITVVEGVCTKKGWHNKPEAMWHAVKHYDKVIWLDTDCEILNSLDDMWSLLAESRLNIVADAPWMKRRGENWYNTGVVGLWGSHPPFQQMLREWVLISGKHRGDQEALNAMLTNSKQFRELIKSLPNKYNFLRLQIDDRDQVEDVRIVHWTGAKGKEIIRQKIRGA